MKKTIILLVLVVITIGAIYFYLQQNQNTQDSSIASGNGRIESTQIHLSAKTSGRVVEFSVDEGDFVKKDEVIAKIEDKELLAIIEGAKAQIEQAEQTKRYSQAQLEQLQSEYELAKSDYHRNSVLFEKKSVSASTYEQYKTRFQSTKATVKAMKSKIKEVEASIRVAEAHLQQLYTQLDDTFIRAPKKARVLYKLAQTGELVNNGQRVATLLDLTDTYMTIFLPTKDAGLVQIGADARIVLDAYPGFSLPAKVTFLSPQAQFTPKQIETKEERAKLMFKVKVSIKEDLLKKHLHKVRTGLPGVAYVRLDNQSLWPKSIPKLYDEE